MRILLVDDDEDIRLFVRRVLESGHHQVTEAENGKVAVEVFPKNQPELIVMDLMMPVMDGHAATKIIKEMSGDNYVPVLFLTSKSDESTLVESLNNGADDFITKPVNIEVLLAKVDALERTVNLHKTITEKNENLKYVNELISADQVESEKIYTRVLDRGKVECDCIRSYQKASYTFNGDIIMTVKKPDGHIGFLIGDFTGHGLPAAICAMPVVDIFYQMSKKGFTIQDIVVEMNSKLSQFLPSERFLAAAMLDLDPVNKSVKIWNAGMPEILIFSNESKLKHKINSNNLPLGIVNTETMGVEIESMSLDDGDLILCYSDGVSEAQSPVGEYFGSKNITQAVVEDNASVDVIDMIVNKLVAFQLDEKFLDDVSLLSIKADYDQLIKAGIDDEVLDVGGDWQVKVRLETKMLQDGDPVAAILSAVTAMRSRCAGRETLQFLLTEMFSNAIEHGLLKLDSSLKKKTEGFETYYKEKEKRLAELKEGYVEVTFIYVESGPFEGVLEIEMEDSGDGFDVANVMSSDTRDEANVLHSRGVSLIQSLSDSVEYNEKGNKINVKLKCSFNQ